MKPSATAPASRPRSDARRPSAAGRPSAVRRRIDLYTIDIGGGHIAPAQAIKQQFDLRGDPDLEVHVVNLGITLRATFLRFLYKFYWDQALRYPPLINAFYRGADNPFLMKIVDRILGITILPKFVRYLDEAKPDVVVSTYFTFTHYLEMLKRVGQLDAVTVVLNPEPFDSHYVWFSPVFDWSMVFSQKSRDEIVEKGIPAQRLKVFPFPIKPSFARRTERPEVLRSRLGLEKKPFTVLFFFGAEGVGPVKKFLAAIAERPLNIQVVVICGRNVRLKTDVERLAAAARDGLTVRATGYVTNLADYIAAADVVVGKSGPNQVFETLLQCRPLIISSFLANEKETTDWVIRNRLGWLTRTPSQLASLLSRLAAHPQELKQSQAAIRALHLHSGAADIAEFLAALARRPRVPRKRPVTDALRKLRDRVVAESGALRDRVVAEGEALRDRVVAEGEALRDRFVAESEALTRRIVTTASRNTGLRSGLGRAAARPRPAAGGTRPDHRGARTEGRGPTSRS